jgi:peroxiredoxin
MFRYFSVKKPFLTIIILLLGLLWIGFTSEYLVTPTDGRITAPQNGFQAPDFSLETLSGEAYTFSQHRGQIFLINFWTSWCPPCRYEMPAMQRVYDKYKDQDLVILGINTTSQDSPVNAAEFVSNNGVTFPVLLDFDGLVTQRYLIRSFPTSFFIDRDGIIRDTVIGGPMAEALIESRIIEIMEGEKE